MERSLFRFVLRHSLRDQLGILALTFLSFPLVYLSLELPKMIVNDAISGTGFPREIMGVSLAQIPYLLALCCAFFGLVVLNNIVKYALNIRRGITGERMLRRLRYALFERVMRFRPREFRRTSPGEIVQVVTAEVEPIGGFIGEVIATPIFQGGTLLVYLIFIFAQDPLLGAAAITFYPVQAWLIPKLQKRVVLLSRERLANIRSLSGDIDEGVTAHRDIMASGAAAWRLAGISERLHRNFEIRLEIFKRKFLIKFINNFLNQLTPFLFYAIGGYLVIKGSLNLGALVAVLAAYKDLAGPWKELLGFYQSQSEIGMRYNAVVKRFDAASIDPVLPAQSDAVPAILSGEIVFADVRIDSDGGTEALLDGASCRIAEGAHVAVIGDDRSPRAAFLAAVAGMEELDGGEVRVGAVSLTDLPRTTIARNIAFVSGKGSLLKGTIRDNLTYGLLRAPAEGKAAKDALSVEARATGNLAIWQGGAWIDHSAADVADASALDARLTELALHFGLGDDLLRLGLSARLDATADDAVAERIAALRAGSVAHESAPSELASVIEPWAPDRLNRHASLAENVLFGSPATDWSRPRDLARWAPVADMLGGTQHETALAGLGLNILRTLVDLFGSLTAESPFLKEVGFISPESAPHFAAILVQVGEKGVEALDPRSRARLVGVAFEYIPAKHRFDLIDDVVEAEILAARAALASLRKEGGALVGFDAPSLSPGLSIRDNLLAGRPRLDRREQWPRIDAYLRAWLEEDGLVADIQRLALQTIVGLQGVTLDPSVRLRLALIRALVRKPAVLVLDEVPIDAEMAILVRALQGGRTLLWGVSNTTDAGHLDEVIVFGNGRITMSAAKAGRSYGTEG